jgi:hypothetical protein
VLQGRTPQKNEAAAIKLAAQTNQVKERILKIGLGHDVTIVRRDAQEFYGRIERIEDAFVVLYEVDLLAYALTCCGMMRWWDLTKIVSHYNIAATLIHLNYE